MSSTLLQFPMLRATKELTDELRAAQSCLREANYALFELRRLGRLLTEMHQMLFGIVYEFDDSLIAGKLEWAEPTKIISVDDTLSEARQAFCCVDLAVRDCRSHAHRSQYAISRWLAYDTFFGDEQLRIAGTSRLHVPMGDDDATPTARYYSSDGDELILKDAPCDRSDWLRHIRSDVLVPMKKLRKAVDVYVRVCERAHCIATRTVDDPLFVGRVTKRMRVA